MLALRIIKVTAAIPYSDALGIIRKQIVRAVTPVASNFRAVCRARSERERFSKLCTVVEEADETIFWLEILVEGEFITPEQIPGLTEETTEILKVMSSFRSRVGSKI